MKRAFQNFLDEIEVAPDSLGLHTAMKNLALSFDLGTFAYIFAPSVSEEGVAVISNYPSSWTSSYLTNRYQMHDPVIAKVKMTDHVFLWGSGEEAFKMDNKSDAFMQEAAAHGICCGFTFPIHDTRSHYAALTFASDGWSPSFRSCYERQNEVLGLLAILFHTKARLALSPPMAVAGVHISPREWECLTWATRGKSAWEIGKILGISRRTAAFHLDNAKIKLGVRTIQQAVALFAVARGQ